VGDAAFVHDTLMQPDVGTSRADFPGGSADDLWNTIQRLLGLPDDTRLFVGHDYCGGGRDDPEWEATVGQHKAENKHLAGKSKDEFIALREERDATLPLPDRMLAALQINLRAGRLPEPEGGRSFLRIPINRF
jgi:glyoxylase-like metal-dependent hydrolase (beta-lactamase superfamily II)